jgi:hypothetical protein
VAAAHKQIMNASIIVRAAFRKRIRDVGVNFDLLALEAEISGNSAHSFCTSQPFDMYTHDFHFERVDLYTNIYFATPWRFSKLSFATRGVKRAFDHSRGRL